MYVSEKFPVNLTDMRFGSLKVIGRSGSIHRWICECDCGKQVVMKRYDLCMGKVTSCGECENEIR